MIASSICGSFLSRASVAIRPTLRCRRSHSAETAAVLGKPPSVWSKWERSADFTTLSAQCSRPKIAPPTMILRLLACPENGVDSAFS